ncbi:MAG: glycoside hydrolase family 3 protein, partial [Candidatus Lokiarchaeota archaeon]|nr:glycoside hydrolase family 3 protein [Candidatus Lokiarchaeota archaeon]MBD3343406.1 glycoside hydrolase family 3 protein [Candidatus Lokiarchaeota archaeon]
VARESIVLLKNQNKILPLKKNLNSIAVIGPNSDTLDSLIGEYYGTPSTYVTPLQGIRNKVAPNTKIFYSKGCDHLGDSKEEFKNAKTLAERSDIVIMFMGLTGQIEGEEGYVTGPLVGDRKELSLPKIQQELLRHIFQTGKPIILVLLSGGCLSVPFSKENVPAILQAWYPGEEGGSAIADVIFGDFNPSGKLPITFYNSVDQLPDFKDYKMLNRTYRYLNENPLFPFGFGLSYTSFEYSDFKISPLELSKEDEIQISVDVLNIGKQPGQEIVQLYLKKLESKNRIPLIELKGFKKIYLKRGEMKKVSFMLTSDQYSIVNEEGNRIIESGIYRIFIGGCQPDTPFSKCLKKSFEITFNKNL